VAELANPTLWREGKPYKSYGYLYLWQPPTVFAARINLPGKFKYPFTVLPFDTVTHGSYTDIEAGMTILIGSAPGLDDRGRTRVRANATSSLIPIGRTPKGIHPGEINVTDNAYITVIDLAEVWAKIPYIDTTGVSLKDQTTFAANIAQPPIANGGPAVIGLVNDDDELVVNFTAAKSAVVDSGASSLTYAWDFGDATPSSSTSATPTGIAFPPGQRYVKLTVDDGTRSHQTRIPVVALEKNGVNAPIPARMTSRSLRPEGQGINFEVKAIDLPYATYPFGTLAIYFEEEWYGATKGSLAGTAGRENVKFVGWLTSEVNTIEATAKGMDYTLTLNALDVTGKLAKLPGFGQRVQRSASPANWQQMKDANISRYLHHLLHWHSTALEVAPYEGPVGIGSYVFTDMSSDGQSLYAQVDQRARAAVQRFVCNTRGEMAVRWDEQRKYAADRVHTVTVALDKRDWSLIGYQYDPLPTIHWLRGSAIIASTSENKSVFCIAPGSTPGQGEGDQDVGEQLALSQFDLNMRTGTDYRRLNMPLKSIDIQLAHGGDAGIDPANMEWVTLGIELTLSGNRKITYPDDTRWYVLESNITVDPATATVTTRLRLEPEAIGLEAETVIPETPADIPPQEIPIPPMIPPYDNWPTDPVVIYPPTTPTPNMPIDMLVMVATDDDNLIVIKNYRKWQVDSVPVNYSDILPELDDGHTIRHAIFSSFGPDAYLLTSDGMQSRLFYCEDVSAGFITWDGRDLIDGEYSRIVVSDTQGAITLLGSGSAASCLSAGWDIAPDRGVIIDSDATSITIEATVYPGSGYQACIYGLTDATCCQIGDEVLSGNISFSNAYINFCGESFDPDSGPLHSALYTGGYCVSALMRFSADPFTVKYTFLGNDDCAPGEGSAIAALAIYSDDFGVTFGDPEITGVVVGGADSIKIGPSMFVGAGGEIVRATTRGGAFTSYADPMPTSTFADLLLVPRYRPGTASTNNISTTTPYLVVGSAVASGADEALWIVDGAGAFTDITPLNSGDPGTVVGPDCLAIPYRSGAKMVGIFDFAGTRRMYKRVSGSWSEITAISSAANYIRMRKGDKQLKEVYFANGSLAGYSPTFGVDMYSTTIPVTGDIISLEVYG